MSRWPIGTPLGCWVGLEPKIFFLPPLETTCCGKRISPVLSQVSKGLAVCGAYLWGRILLPDFSLPLGLAVLKLRWMVELGWAQERLTLLSGNYRLRECQRWRNGALVKSHIVEELDPDILGLHLLLFSFYLAAAQRLFL